MELGGEACGIFRLVIVSEARLLWFQFHNDADNLRMRDWITASESLFGAGLLNEVCTHVFCYIL